METIRRGIAGVEYNQISLRKKGNSMIYTDQQLVKKIRKMIVDFEDEVVEFKEARTNYSFKDIGKYFSALGNEANIRGLKEAWLIFGVTNNKEIVGSAYRQDGNLQHLKKRLLVGQTKELLLWKYMN